MMRVTAAVFAVILCLPATCYADGASFSFGGDQYAAGENAAVQSAVEHDAFIAGRQLDLSAPVSGTAHLIGMNVSSDASVGGNLYAAGFNIEVSAPVLGSVTAIGNAVSVKQAATIGGNARLLGASVTLAAPVTGSVLVSAKTLTLDGTVQRDLNFYGESLVFGPGAKVDGTLFIQAPKPIEVPASVAAADHVKYTAIASPDYMSQAGNVAGTAVNGLWPALWAIALWWLLLFVIGVGFIALAPRVMNGLQTAAATRPFRSLGMGVLAFALLLGLVPVAAITLIGIPLLPIIFAGIAVGCVLAYLAGLYSIGLRIGAAITSIESNGRRIAVYAAALVVAGLLGMIPMLGWLIGVLLVLFGLGIMTVALLGRRSGGRSGGTVASPVVPAT
ncbi:MAG: hypothetical protein P4M09_10305 [Devosia sp.]|nr:hypothetical protein [Devosia sp.]